MRVALQEVPERQRVLVTRRIREKRWQDELWPDTGYVPTMEQRLAALWDAIELERAAVAPSERGYLLPEQCVKDVLGEEWSG